MPGDMQELYTDGDLGRPGAHPSWRRYDRSSALVVGASHAKLRQT
jgi:hypothetical protein